MPGGTSWQLPVPGISLKPPDFLGSVCANTPEQTDLAQSGFGDVFGGAGPAETRAGSGVSGVGWAGGGFGGVEVNLELWR